MVSFGGSMIVNHGAVQNGSEINLVVTDENYVKSEEPATKDTALENRTQRTAQTVQEIFTSNTESSTSISDVKYTRPENVKLNKSTWENIKSVFNEAIGQLCNMLKKNGIIKTTEEAYEIRIPEKNKKNAQFVVLTDRRFLKDPATPLKAGDNLREKLNLDEHTFKEVFGENTDLTFREAIQSGIFSKNDLLDMVTANLKEEYENYGSPALRGPDPDREVLKDTLSVNLMDTHSCDREVFELAFSKAFPGQTLENITFGDFLYQALIDPGEDEHKSRKKITGELVGGSQRNRAEVELGEMKFTQSACHSTNGNIVKGTTTSSEANKKYDYNQKTRDYCSNHNVITDQNDSLVSTRCGRMDTVGRVYEAVEVSLDASLKSTKEGKFGKGLSLGEDGMLHYQMSVTSGQDTSFLKNLWLGIKTVFGLRKDALQDVEVRSVENIKRSIQEIWGDKDYIEIVAKNDKGEKITVRVDRPIFKTAILSGEGAGEARKIVQPEAINDNRLSNLEDSKRERVLLNKKLENWDHGFETPKAVGIYNRLKSYAKTDANFFTSYQGGREDIANIKAEINALPPGEEKNKLLKLYFSIQAVTINLTGKDLSGKDRCSYDDPQDAGRVAILDMYLHDFLNISENDQCKSGCDRTLFLTCSRLAMISFEKEKGYPADPLEFKSRYDDIPEGHDQKRFAELFTAAAQKFGSNVVYYTRGKNQVKWGGHAPVKMFGNFTKHSKHGDLIIT